MPPRDPPRTTPEEPLDESPLTTLIGYQLAQATVVTSRVFQSRVGKPQDLNTVEYTMLALIRANPGVSPTQLRKAMGISKPYVTAGLEKLHARRLISREVNSSDQRAQCLFATPDSARLVEAMTAELLAGERETMSTLSSAEHAILAELLHKLAQARN